tara:strand:+ start:925 stop:1119 length:195 start_codon:yes stop_codon:yes gene_type:complete
MSHKVVIELEFMPKDGKRVLSCDVYDYLEELIADESLDYTVSHGEDMEHSYGVIDHNEMSSPMQ